MPFNVVRLNDGDIVPNFLSFFGCNSAANSEEIMEKEENFRF